MAKNWVLRLSETAVANTGERNHRRVLSILLFLYGCLHLVATAFVWIVIFALVSEGYRDSLRDLNKLILMGMTLVVIVMPLLSGYALLRGRPWARGVLSLTCVAILIVSIIALWQISWPRLSSARIVFGILYGGASLAMCIYGFWFVRKRWPIDG
jgi:hypothetical protein